MFFSNSKQVKSLLGSTEEIVPLEDVAAKVNRLQNRLIDPELCLKAGLPEKRQKDISTFLLLFAAFLVIITLITKAWTVLLFVFIASFVTRLYLNTLVAQRVSGFDKDFAALLLSLASSLKAGVDATSALERSVHLFPTDSVMHEQLAQFVRDLASGQNEEQVIKSFASTIDHPDIDLFRKSFLLSRKQGGSLSMCLQRLARFTRQRQSFRRKIGAAIAMQKLSAFGIGGCALIIIFIQLTTQYESFLEAVGHPLGFRMLSIGVILLVIGIGMMLRIASNGAGGRV